jgi:fucose 4-O-acetylase-like acetyltransferase
MLLNNYLKKEYVYFAESDAIKAILILLIILSHNHYIAPEGGLLYRFLYKFHVICFFILPFYYDKKKKFNFRNNINIFIKCYIPYFFFFVLCMLVLLFAVHAENFN